MAFPYIRDESDRDNPSKEEIAADRIIS